MPTSTSSPKRTSIKRSASTSAPLSLEQTGSKVAKLASRQLRDPKSTKAQKSVAASALTQATKRG